MAAGAGYRLSFRYRTPGLDHADGLEWQVWDYAGERIVPAPVSKLDAQPGVDLGEADS